MDPVRFYRSALFLPFVIPLLAIPIALGGGSSSPGNTAAVLVMSLVYGGIPYLILTCVLYPWMRGRAESEVRRASFVAPLLLLPLQFAALALVSVFTGASGSSLRGWLGLLGYFGAWVLLVGYCYVAIVNLALWVGKRYGWVQSASPA